MEARRFRLGAAEGRASRGKSHPSRVDLLRGRWWDAKPGGGRACGRLSASTMWPDNVPVPGCPALEPSRSVSRATVKRDGHMQSCTRRRRRQSGRRMLETKCQARRDWQPWVCPLRRAGGRSQRGIARADLDSTVQRRRALHRGVSIRPGRRRARQAWAPFHDGC
jgi:hypothetical protein